MAEGMSYMWADHPSPSGGIHYTSLGCNWTLPLLTEILCKYTCLGSTSSYTHILFSFNNQFVYNIQPRPLFNRWVQNECCKKKHIITCHCIAIDMHTHWMPRSQAYTRHKRYGEICCRCQNIWRLKSHCSYVHMKKHITPMHNNLYRPRILIG